MFLTFILFHQHQRERKSETETGEERETDKPISEAFKHPRNQKGEASLNLVIYIDIYPAVYCVIDWVVELVAKSPS